MLLEGAQHHNFHFLTVSNNNMADSKIAHVGGIEAPLVLES
jgi:hypothetical protein